MPFWFCFVLNAKVETKVPRLLCPRPREKPLRPPPQRVKIIPKMVLVVFLLLCFLWFHLIWIFLSYAKLCVFSGGSSTASTKSATIEMYVGSSTGYNDTMSGETMSSISEKSGSYISEEHHHGSHGGQGHHHRLHHHQQQPQHLMQTTEFDVWPLSMLFLTSLSKSHFSASLYNRKKTYEYPHCPKPSHSRAELTWWTTTRNCLSRQLITRRCLGSLPWPPLSVIVTR